MVMQASMSATLVKESHPSRCHVTGKESLLSFISSVTKVNGIWAFEKLDYHLDSY